MARIQFMADQDFSNIQSDQAGSGAQPSLLSNMYQGWFPQA
jgi:hypothetical protein